jgi:hypothetical protein
LQKPLGCDGFAHLVEAQRDAVQFCEAALMKSRWFVFFLGMLFGAAMVLGSFYFYTHAHHLP